jgi:hypothetical protein
MLCEAFRCLTVFGPLDSYRYVGFGSTYFTDFTLFHKTLGIHQMVSIEQDIVNKPRFNFNRPFKCIRMKFGHSTDMLPVLNWHDKTILWLDYEVKVSDDVLEDVATFCGNASPGSVLVVTVNARHPAEEEIEEKSLVDKLGFLQDLVGSDKVPSDVGNSDLGVDGFPRVSRRIIDNAIREILSNRNRTRQVDHELGYTQLFNFQYEDTSPMLTVGGMIHEKKQSEMIKNSGIEKLPFIRKQSTPYTIDVPKLTFREIRYLDSHLPLTPPEKLRDHKIPKRDLRHYSEIYRYFPTFVEAEL